jgi:hypothetical protein
VTSPETKELMNRTWQDLELTTKAHTFSGKVKIGVKVFFFSKDTTDAACYIIDVKKDRFIRHCLVASDNNSNT